MNKKISILYIIDRIAGVYGTEKHLLELISGLDKEKFSPVIVAFNPQVAPEFYDLSIPIFTFNVTKIHSPANLIAVYKISRIIRKYKIDIIETYHSTSDILGPVIGRLSNVKCVLSNRRDMGFLRTKKHDMAYPVVNKFVDRIKVVCDAAAKYFSEKERTPIDKYELFYNGIHIEKYNNTHHDGEGLRKSFGIDPSETVVGIVGNVKPIKGQINLVDIAEKLSANYSNIRFLVVGGGLKNRKNEYLEKIQSQLAQKQLLEQFIFTGHRKDVPELIQIIDIALMLSETEGCSNVLLEYMASGKPVIATDVGGNPELIINNHNGFTVPAKNGIAVAEKIKTLLEDPELRKSMGKKAFELALEKFDFDAALKKEAQLYVDAIRDRQQINR